jgi:type IV pilus assembly protein PilQ
VAAGVAVGLCSAVAALAADTKTISSVEVQEQDGTTRIVLRGAEDPIYTAFMREDPPRLIVELPDVIFSGVDSPIRVGNGVVDNVTLGAFGDPRVALSMARVTVGLSADSEYELLPDGDELVIEIRPSGDAQRVAKAESQAETASTTPEQAMPLQPVAEPVEESTVPASPDKAPEATPAQAEPMAPASTPEEPTAEALEEAIEAQLDPQPEPTPGPASESSPAAAASESTSRLLEVKASAEGVEIVADGPIDNVDSFTLENPSRLVVDFWGVKNSVHPATREVDWTDVSKVRVGQHPDKVRVVFDLRNPLAAHEVQPTSAGVKIQMNSDAAAIELPSSDMPSDADETADSGENQDQAPPAAAADDGAATDATDATETTEAADAEAQLPPSHWSEPGRVESVHFESLPTTDRIVVSLNHPVQAEMVSPDDATLIVMLKETDIAGDAERRVDTGDFGGPVEHFSVFRTPDVDYQEVRVVLKRRGPGAGKLDWSGNQLHIEMPRETADGTWEMPEDGAADAGHTGSGADGAASPDPAAAKAAAQAEGSAPTLGAEMAEAGDPFLLDGPADPAAIDLLEEGGFSDEKRYTGRRISLDFKDADIGNILRLIAEVSDLNVIAGEEVNGKVTIRLVDVPWDQALDVVLLTKGLGFVRVGNVLRIAPIETLKLEAEARLQDRRAKEKLEDLIVKLQPVNFADVREIQGLVKKLLSKRGTVNTDKRTNTLIIKDIPSVVQEATALVKAIDTATPQVLIESKIVEASLSFSRALGATWGVGYNANGSQGGAPDFHLADGTNPDLIGLANGSQTSNFIAANPIFDANNGFLSLGLLGLDDHIQLDLAIEAAESNNKGKVISSPRVVTLDNREAVIKQGVAIKFEAATRDKITISFIDAVLELKVTPHITANRSIIMKIKISRNAPSISGASGEIVGIDKNEANTEALVRDGETIVLGGIYVVDSGKSSTKTPFLADIPLIGAAFQSRVVKDERRELLIFVTPRIIMGTPAPTTDL